MKKINKLQILKPYIIGFIFGLSFVSGFTLASGTNGTIGDLFKKLDIGWVLKGDNIEDGTIDSSEIENGTIKAEDVEGDSITSSELADDIVFNSINILQNAVIDDNLYVSGDIKMNSKKVATEEFVTDKNYMTSVPSNYATQDYVNNKGYITSSSLSTYATKDYVSDNSLQGCTLHIETEEKCTIPPGKWNNKETCVGPYTYSTNGSWTPYISTGYNTKFKLVCN